MEHTGNNVKVYFRDWEFNLWGCAGGAPFKARKGSHLKVSGECGWRTCKAGVWLHPAPFMLRCPPTCGPRSMRRAHARPRQE
jgi:hypothetical protein